MVIVGFGIQTASVGKLMVQVPLTRVLGDVRVCTMFLGHFSAIGQGVRIASVGCRKIEVYACPRLLTQLVRIHGRRVVHPERTACQLGLYVISLAIPLRRHTAHAHEAS